MYLNGLVAGAASVQVRDALGKLVLHQPIKEDRSPLELGGLIKGVYYVSVEQADQKTVQKLIKQ